MDLLGLNYGTGKGQHIIIGKKVKGMSQIESPLIILVECLNDLQKSILVIVEVNLALQILPR